MANTRERDTNKQQYQLYVMVTIEERISLGAGVEGLGWVTFLNLLAFLNFIAF
jgi:hypothetical protein